MIRRLLLRVCGNSQRRCHFSFLATQASGKKKESSYIFVVLVVRQYLSNQTGAVIGPWLLDRRGGLIGINKFVSGLIGLIGGLIGKLMRLCGRGVYMIVDVGS